jgi:two-component system cell cycle sensor histidine kinase/response regulator CckA
MGDLNCRGYGQTEERVHLTEAFGAAGDGGNAYPVQAIRSGMRKIEHREWWLWSSAVLVTLLLTLCLGSFALPMLHVGVDDDNTFQLTRAMRGLVGLVLLFDVYVVYQQLQIYRMRRRLMEREELFRLISENAADMIAVVDGQGNRVYNSPAYERILGYTLEELRSTSAFEQIHPDDRAQVQAAAKEAVEGEARSIEYRMRHKDGNWRILESTASTIRDIHGNVEKLVIVNRDISERRLLETQIRQGQKMEAVGRLSGGIAHDFNNLLGVIIGYGEMLQEGIPADDSRRMCIDEILGAGRRAASLTRQLLAFSRQQVLEPRVLDLKEVITDTEKMLQRVIGEDIELRTAYALDLGRVKADQGQIEQVILNMAVNARDAMPNGGKLSIEAANAEMTAADIRRYSYPVKPGEYVLLTISDTGTGMDAATRAHIFEPFFTTKEKGKGTGLGLATAYGVVKQSDGYIEVESELGSGTTFKIYLPKVEAPLHVESDHEHMPSSAGGDETILLVEDETKLRDLAGTILGSLGYRVLMASDGVEACELSQAYAEQVDLLLTDVVMPRMNGRETAERLGQERPGIKVLYMSGYTGQGVGQGVLPEGCYFLAKPFTREKLATKVREVLETDSLDLIKTSACKATNIEGELV